MPAPLKPHLFPVVLHDEDAVPFGTSGNPVHVDAAISPSPPGTTITTVADTAVGVGVTAPLPAPPAGTTRMTVQNTGPAGTLIRVREVGGPAGSGLILARYASVSYGGSGGAVDTLEVQDVAAIATTVAIQFEGT